MKRTELGQPKTVDELIKMLDPVHSHSPLMVRNGTLPTLYRTVCDGVEYLEIESPVSRLEEEVR